MGATSSLSPFSRRLSLCNIRDLASTQGNLIPAWPDGCILPPHELRTVPSIRTTPESPRPEPPARGRRAASQAGRPPQRLATLTALTGLTGLVFSSSPRAPRRSPLSPDSPDSLDSFFRSPAAPARRRSPLSPDSPDSPDSFFQESGRARASPLATGLTGLTGQGFRQTRPSLPLPQPTRIRATAPRPARAGQPPRRHHADPARHRRLGASGQRGGAHPHAHHRRVPGHGPRGRGDRAQPVQDRPAADLS
jgi:hypothetical protein